VLPFVGGGALFGGAVDLLDEGGVDLRAVSCGYRRAGGLGAGLGAAGHDGRRGEGGGEHRHAG
jgi:hypothetical protein